MTHPSNALRRFFSSPAPLARLAGSCLLAAVLPVAAHAQTTLPASTTSTPWDNTATLATGTGLTINLGLGAEYLIVGGGGGGGAGVSTFTKAGDGTAGTGSGGGGSGYTDPGVFVNNSRYGGSGGSGVVIVRYQSATRLASGGSSSGTTGAYQWEQFSTTGTSTLTLSFTPGSLLATQSGEISGTGGLTYASGGTLILGAANTFSGATRSQAGVLSLGNVAALQNSTLDMNGSDSGTIDFGVAGTNTYTIGGLQGSRNLNVGGNSLSVGGNAASTTYSGGLCGSGGFTKTGAGTLTFTGSNMRSTPTARTCRSPRPSRAAAARSRRAARATSSSPGRTATAVRRAWPAAGSR